MQSEPAFIDVGFLEHPGIVGTGVLRTRSGIVLVDPGPSSALEGLARGLQAMGLSLADVRGVLLTHIHLDHAGATGSIVGQRPDVPVYVHERGARHVADPARLLESATRIYGDQMDRLWGAILPVPESNLHPLSGGEHLELDGRRLDVAYTPGHAVHHVSYLDLASMSAFVGDTGGVCLPRAPQVVVPPTPPPDIALETWKDSIALIGAWKPSRLYVTHFGPVAEPERHLQELRRQLDVFADLVWKTLEQPGTDDERIRAFVREVVAGMRTHLSEEDVRQYELAMPLDHCWLGLARYWRKKRS